MGMTEIHIQFVDGNSTSRIDVDSLEETRYYNLVEIRLILERMLGDVNRMIETRLMKGDLS